MCSIVQRVSTPIKNIKAYLGTSFSNASITFTHYWTAETCRNLAFFVCGKL